MEGEKVLQKWQKNQVLGAMKAEGLEPSDFDWRNSPAVGLLGRPGRPHTQLVFHKRFPENRFTFRYVEDYNPLRQHEGTTLDFAIDFVPGLARPRQTVPHLNWDQVLGYVQMWLASLHRNLSEPDLWAQLQEHSPEVEELAEELGRNEYFTAQEQAVLVDRLDTFERELLSLPAVGPDDIEYLKHEVQDLRDEVSKLTKWKWMKLGLATVGQIGIRLALDHVDFAHLFQAFVNVVYTLHHLPPPL